MSKYIKNTSKKAGLRPGTLVFIGDKKTEKAKFTIFEYNETEFKENKTENIEDCFLFKNNSKVTWIDIDSLHDTSKIEKLGECFELHSFIQEDIVDTGQRPKLEDFGKHLFIVLKMLTYDEINNEILSEQVSLVIGQNFLFSFQEKEGDVFDGVRDRIKNAKGKIRKLGPDYLAYALLDAIIDNYFIILEKIGDRIENMENELINDPKKEILNAIHKVKRDTIVLRKSVWPLRELIANLQRGESEIIRESTNIYFRNVYDHTIQVIDTIETFRDMASGMLDIYLSSLSNKMNEVMKVLTIIATIFIPTTFIAGIYGMNFNPESSPWNMPELNWKYGYISVWAVIILMIGGMLIYFRRKKWL
jgi:magnesium transporter